MQKKPTSGFTIIGNRGQLSSTLLHLMSFQIDQDSSLVISHFKHTNLELESYCFYVLGLNDDSAAKIFSVLQTHLKTAGRTLVDSHGVRGL